MKIARIKYIILNISINVSANEVRFVIIYYRLIFVNIIGGLSKN